jgi:hypothetical protein
LIPKNEHIYGLRKQEVVKGVDRLIGVIPMLLTGPIKKTSDAFIEWKEITFFCAEASSMEMVRNSHLFME